MATVTTPPAAPAPTPAPAPVPPAAPTLGWRSSEAWLSLLVTLMGALPASGLLAGAPPLALKIVGIITSLITVLGYTQSRAKVKIAHYQAHTAYLGACQVRALAAPAPMAAAAGGFVRLHLMPVVAVFMAVVMACGATFTQMTGAFTTCAKADLNQMINPPTAGNPLSGLLPAALESFLVEIVTLNTTALEAQLTALAAIVGTAAVKCAIAAVDAVFSTPTSPSSGSGSNTVTGVTQAQARVVPAGIARAKAWAAAN